MIIVTKQGQRETPPYFHAFSKGVFAFTFHGDETYTDPFDGSVWTWEGVDNTITEVIGVSAGSVNLTQTISINDCIALQSSFFWDDATGVLYAHWPSSHNDYAVGRESVSFSQVVPGFASGHHALTNNVFDGVYYESLITNISGLSENVDPTKLGLIAFDDSSFTVTNQSGRFDTLAGTDVVGNPVQFFRVPETATALTDDMRIFTGFFSGYTNDRESITFQVIESRLFDNRPVCPNILSLDDWPNAGDLENSAVPTAWGDINRGIMLLTNIDDLETQPDITRSGDTANGSAVIAITDTTDLETGMAVTGSGIPDGATILSFIADTSITIDVNCTVTVADNEITFIFPVQLATFLVSDSALDSVGAITNVRDASGNILVIDSVNLIACTVTVEKVASLAPNDLKKWTWEGQGYIIDGEDRNGLNIMKDAFLKLASTPFLASTYNVTEWNAATTDNPQFVGISLQSDKGFIELLLQPIMTSLQGALKIQGDGKITFYNRDITAAVSDTIDQADQIDEPGIQMDSSQLVSELVVEYSPNFVTKAAGFIYVNSANKSQVVADYSIDRRDPLSPVKTILVNEVDVIAISEEIMSTSADPNRIIKVDSLDIIDIRIFNVLAIDTGKFNANNLEYGEVLTINPNYITERQTLTMRVIPDYTP